MSAWNLALLAGWAVLLVNLAMTLRVVRKLRAEQELQERAAELQHAPDVEVGVPAPRFRARTLDGNAVGLEDFAGRPVTFLVVSPDCPICRRELRGLIHLAKLAREKAGVQFVLVSDYGITATNAWLQTLREEQRVEVDVPVLVAPPAVSDFLPAYDPRVLTPFHVFVREDGVVGSRGPVGAGDWLKLRATWEDAGMVAALRRSAG
jgi:thiol-disulfide isomerase/thioredoxin